MHRSDDVECVWFFLCGWGGWGRVSWFSQVRLGLPCVLKVTTQSHDAWDRVKVDVHVKRDGISAEAAEEVS